MQSQHVGKKNTHTHTQFYVLCTGYPAEGNLFPEKSVKQSLYIEHSGEKKQTNRKRLKEGGHKYSKRDAG